MGLGAYPVVIGQKVVRLGQSSGLSRANDEIQTFTPTILSYQLT